MEEKRISSRKVRVGKVVSDKMDKTVVVAIEDRVAHPLYKKIVGRTYKLKAHDEDHPVEKERRFRMNCPYCAKEMESGYLRGGSGYELLWTEEPFKMTSLPTGNDFFVCKASDVYRPIAHLCRACGKIVLDIKK